MYDLFGEVDKFFNSLNSYINYNKIFWICVGLFLLTIVFTIISTSHSYESRLIKTIDSLNSYFIDNPQITEDNLVAFNARMKRNKVPKQLRKQWQQFVLYREKKASEYMSFESCVSNPIKNSTFKRDIMVMNIISYIIAVVALTLNLYYSYEDTTAMLLQHAFLTPAIVLLLNFIVTIFLDLRHNAVVSDLFQNYQYFEVNIDKATQTLPEYVDYEVLFDRNEIKKGIPILYTYLQKRAEEEKRELERARIKNIEHEKYNFEEAGVNGSLVLERAMQEAENYIAERKKYDQDTAQINSDITQEDANYREITKEYNRQMQVSKETFANFKSQLEEASSSIEVNYLKKQQQQELDRQRNLERDFDAQTERHKKIIESYQAELDSVDKFREQSRQALETAMMSEFETYNGKVYDEANKLVKERNKEKVDGLKEEIRALEEKLNAKDEDLENAYNEIETLTSRLQQYDGVYENYHFDKPIHSETVDQSSVPVEEQPVYEDDSYDNAQEEYTEDMSVPSYDDYAEDDSSNNQDMSIPSYNDYAEEAPAEDMSIPTYNDYAGDNSEDMSIPTYNDYGESEEDKDEGDNNADQEEYFDFEEDKGLEAPKFEDYDKNEEDDEDDGLIIPTFDEYDEEESDKDILDEEPEDETAEDVNAEDEGLDEVKQPENKVVAQAEVVEEKPRKKAGRPRKIKTEEDNAPKRRVGRPRKEKTEDEDKPKRKVGRPRKEKVEEDNAPKRKVGRPKKEVKEETKVAKKKAGRPRKEEETPKKKAGRPRKEKIDSEEKTKKRVGRPRKEESETREPKKKVGRPRKEKSEDDNTPKRKVGRPKKKGPGRPRKGSSGERPQGEPAEVDLDEYLKEIDQAIAAENKKLQEARKILARNTKISRKK